MAMAGRSRTPQILRLATGLRCSILLNYICTKDHVNTREMRRFLILYNTSIQRNQALESATFSTANA